MSHWRKLRTRCHNRRLAYSWRPSRPRRRCRRSVPWRTGRGEFEDYSRRRGTRYRDRRYREWREFRKGHLVERGGIIAEACDWTWANESSAAGEKEGTDRSCIGGTESIGADGQEIVECSRRRDFEHLPVEGRASFGRAAEPVEVAGASQGEAKAGIRSIGAVHILAEGMQHGESACGSY